jgi:glucose-6-phosphate isomerase
MLKPFDLRSSQAHKRLIELAKTDGQQHLVSLFAEDPNRFEAMHSQVPGILYDWSKHRVTENVMSALFNLAEEAGWEAGRNAMFGGEAINQTEGRAVLHAAMRGEVEDGFSVNGQKVMPEVIEVRDCMLDFASSVQASDEITDVVNIGIGGSDLGPLMVTKGLRNFASGPKIHFVSNVDGAHLDSVLAGLSPAQTLFIVVSKTFTTQETMANAIEAKRWLVHSLGEDAVPDHFAAVSTNREAAQDFGVSADCIFGFENWVGGRYSLWGPVGLAVACSIGADHFRSLLSGARQMDRHFQEAKGASNLPLVAALIGVWYVEYLKFPTYAVLPYAQDLDRFPAYLQQADMESNGKSMGRDGRRIKHHSGPVIWGEAGTNGQHAFYQLIHQGTTIHPADIIACVEPHSRFEKHHEKLLANAIAQAEALMIGKPLATVETELEARGFDAEMIQSSAPHRVFEGNRPTGFILMDRLDPHSLGQLIAWYEHRIFLQGLFWNVCSYDQWGVELGKQLAGQILKEWNGGEFLQHDASSAALMKHIALKRQD